MRPLVFIDTETDGLNPRTRQAWEVAMIRVSAVGREVQVFMVALADVRAAEPVALQIGGYYDRHPAGRAATNKAPLDPASEALLTEYEAALAVCKFTQGATIVGAQPSFDTITLDNLLHKYDLRPEWYHRLRDVESMTTGFLRADVGGLQDCAKALGIESPEAGQHTALGDALLAERIYNRVTGKMAA